MQKSNNFWARFKLIFEIFLKEESCFGTFQKYVLFLKIVTKNLSYQVKSGKIERIE